MAVTIHPLAKALLRSSPINSSRVETTIDRLREVHQNKSYVGLTNSLANIVNLILPKLDQPSSLICCEKVQSAFKDAIDEFKDEFFEQTDLPTLSSALNKFFSTLDSNGIEPAEQASFNKQSASQEDLDKRMEDLFRNSPHQGSYELSSESSVNSFVMPERRASDSSINTSDL